MCVANILVNVDKGIEIGAEDVLKWFTGAARGEGVPGRAGREVLKHLHFCCRLPCPIHCAGFIAKWVGYQ